MSDVIISITNRIARRPNGGYCDELLSAKQFAELSLGCTRVLEKLEPELRLCIELIKIVPFKYWLGGQLNGIWCYKYEARVILLIPDIQKFECSAQFGDNFHGRRCDLSETFFLSVMESIKTTLTSHQRNLRAKVASIEKLFPAETLT
jgi:hypothetical protein